MNTPTRPTWIEISQSALTNNIRQIRQRIGPRCLLMAVVKANAYGHGAIPCAQAFVAAGADRLAVATLSEALELRQAGLKVPLLVLGYTPAWLLQDALAYDITTTLYDLSTVNELSEVAHSANKRALIHIKVNTGMNRLGAAPDEALQLLAEIRALKSIHVEGIFTHFATADEADKSFAQRQLSRFQALLTDLQKNKLRPPLAHAANSAATLTLAQTHFDMVRIGIALYGLHPDPAEAPLPSGFQAALRWKTQVAQVRTLQVGEAVSYGCTFTATTPTITATLPVGYADGFPRTPNHWGCVLVRGAFAPIVGRVCMDQTVIDVTEIVAQSGPMCSGEEVVLLGQQGDALLDAETVAQRTGTINYEVVSRILARVPRIMK